MLRSWAQYPPENSRITGVQLCCPPRWYQGVCQKNKSLWSEEFFKPLKDYFVDSSWSLTNSHFNIALVALFSNLERQTINKCVTCLKSWRALQASELIYLSCSSTHWQPHLLFPTACLSKEQVSIHQSITEFWIYELSPSQLLQSCLSSALRHTALAPHACF